jgi:hypothetical protein
MNMTTPIEQIIQPIASVSDNKAVKTAKVVLGVSSVAGGTTALVGGTATHLAVQGGLASVASGLAASSSPVTAAFGASLVSGVSTTGTIVFATGTGSTLITIATLATPIGAVAGIVFLAYGLYKVLKD